MGCLVVLLLLVLLPIGAYVLFGDQGSLTRFLSNNVESLDSHEVVVDAAEVHDLHIDWQTGPVEIVPLDKDDQRQVILLTEEYLSEEVLDYPMVMELEQGELSIQYGSKGEDFPSSREGKRLTIRMPEELMHGLGAVRMSVVNGSIRANGIECDALDLEVGSGDATLVNLQCPTLTADVSSGHATLRGTFKERIVASAASGSLLVASEVIPTITKISVSSGNATLELPKKNAHFKVKLKREGWGDFKLKFPAQEEGMTYVVGEGGRTINAKVGAGSLCIKPLSIAWFG